MHIVCNDRFRFSLFAMEFGVGVGLPKIHPNNNTSPPLKRISRRQASSKLLSIFICTVDLSIELCVYTMIPLPMVGFVPTLTGFIV